MAAEPSIGRRRPRTATIVETAADAAALDLPPLLVLEPLRRLFDEVGLGSGPIEAQAVGDGHSNATFLIRRGSDEWVLRRPPRPPYPPSTHDVLREYRILRACEDASVRTPRPVMACDDESVIGAPFYVMGFVDGTVITDSVPDELASEAQRRRVGLELIDALVEIHELDWRAVGLDGFGRSDGYLERQLWRFGGLWDTYRERSIPALDEARRLLEERCPESPPATLVHGDFRLGNVLFALSEGPRLAAVVDWEMATIGDPLADLGYLTAMWAEPGDSSGVLLDLGAATAEPGFHSRDELAAAYEERTGRSTEALPWYEALACWKTAILLEGSYRKLKSGTAFDPFFERLERGVPELAERALDALRRL